MSKTGLKITLSVRADRGLAMKLSQVLGGTALLVLGGVAALLGR